MSKTITFHNGTTLCQEHNRRNEKYTDKQSHIDKSLRDKNVILVDKKLKDAYEEIFGDAVKEYNAKQKRSDRKIKDYYQKIKDDKQRNLVYECIVQIGDASDTGINSPKEREALLSYATGWKKRNPNLELVGCYLHADESEGTTHLHIDYIPVAKVNKRGMAIQNSFEKALNEQGFKSENANKTAQMKWEQNERKVLENICTKLGIDAKANQDKTKGRGHLSVAEYKSAKQDMLAEVQEEKATIENTIASYTPPEKGRLESSKAYEERKKTYQEMQLIKNKEQEFQRIQQQLLERERQVQQNEEEIYRKKKNLDEIERIAEERGIKIGEKRQAKMDEKEYTEKIDNLNQQIQNIYNQSNANYELLEKYLHEECNVDANMDIDDILKLQREKENGFEY
jgi:hypothetical protein